MKNISVGTHKLKLDFANGASGVLFSTQADSGRTFEVQVLDEENNVQDITGLTLDFFVGTAKEVTKVSATIKDAVNGIFEINAVSSQFKYAGVHKAQFVLRDATGAKIGTQIYNIHVEESIENGATVGENVIVSFEAISEAAELLRNSGAVLEESKVVSATLKTDITKAETIDTTLKATTKTAEDTNTKAQTTNATLTKTIETANTANANTTNTLKQLTAENDEATLNITALDEKNKLATTNITDLTSSTNTANTSNTNLKATITNAETAEQKLKTEIVNAGLENYITLEDIKNKADLGANGKVKPEQIPQIGGRNLLLNSEAVWKNLGEVQTVNGEEYVQVGYEWVYNFDVNLEEGETYTVSVPVHNSNEITLTARLSVGFKPMLSVSGGGIVNPGQSIHAKHTFKSKNSGVVKVYILTEKNVNNLKLLFGKAKLERGAVATDWTPAPEDFAPKEHTHPTLPTQNQIDAWNLATKEGSPNRRFTVIKDNVDANTLTEEWVLMTGANTPGTGYWYINTIYSGSTRKLQIAYEYSHPLNRVYIRTCYDNTWREWTSGVEVINSLTSISTTSPLSAAQGKTIWDHIVANQANWNKDTTYGVATTTSNGLMSSADKGKLDNIESNAQKNTITSVQGRTGEVTISKTDLGLGNVENIGIKILTQAQYDGLSTTEKARTGMLYAIKG